MFSYTEHDSIWPCHNPIYRIRSKNVVLPKYSVYVYMFCVQRRDNYKRITVAIVLLILFSWLPIIVNLWLHGQGIYHFSDSVLYSATKTYQTSHQKYHLLFSRDLQLVSPLPKPQHQFPKCSHYGRREWTDVQGLDCVYVCLSNELWWSCGVIWNPALGNQPVIVAGTYIHLHIPPGVKPQTTASVPNLPLDMLVGLNVWIIKVGLNGVTDVKCPNLMKKKKCIQRILVRATTCTSHYTLHCDLCWDQLNSCVDHETLQDLSKTKSLGVVNKCDTNEVHLSHILLSQRFMTVPVARPLSIAVGS